MINRIEISMAGKQNNPHKTNMRYLNIKYSGYAALTLGSVCGITGLSGVRFPHKMKGSQIQRISCRNYFIMALGRY